MHSPVITNARDADACCIYGCRAGKQLTELVMKQHVSQGLPFMKGLFKSQDQKQASRKPAVVPPPAQRPFPWEMASSKAAQ